MKPLFLRWLLALAASMVAAVAAPPNDNFGNAQNLTGAPLSVTGTNVGATTEPGESFSYIYASASVWYSWTAPSSGKVDIDTFGSNFDTMLIVCRGSSVGALTEIASNDQADLGLQSKVTCDVHEGEVYKIAVCGFFDAQGSIALNVSAPYLLGSISGTVVGPDGQTSLQSVQVRAYA